MKVILSRKGFDSQYGRIPSPILPDGTLLSFPIPTKEDLEVRFSDIRYKDNSYYDLIRMLSPTTKIKEYYTCHLDPDIRAAAKERSIEWMPAFGQESAALGHLRNQGVGIGDLFLFFGSFRQTEYSNGGLSFKKGAPNRHVIYGYLQVGDIIDHPSKVPKWLEGHPHVKEERWKHQNVIFIASERLSLHPELPGAGCFMFDPKLVLTKSGYGKSCWNLPDFFRQIPVSYHTNPWREDFFQSAAKGQEFVFDANEEVLKWIKSFMP